MAAFFAVVAFVLEEAFQQSAELALKEKLQIEIYSLLSVAEMDEALQLQMPDFFHEPRFSNPSSGLYAVIRLSDQSLVWRSDSAVGVDLPVSKELPQGQFSFQHIEAENRFALHYAVMWRNQQGFERSYIFSVVEEDSFIAHQVARFRMTLAGWLGGMGFLLMLIQFSLLRWGLKPLRKIGQDLTEIDAGIKNKLDGNYPAELSGLSGNLNALISSERAHMERYRNTLADLAHSLKTPLAILRGCAESEIVDSHTVMLQIDRMNEIVEYQLQKAAAKGQKQFAGSVEIGAIIHKIISSLEKVYSDKAIAFQFEEIKGCRIHCEEGDIYEIAGNLLDNSAKWCVHSIAVTMKKLEGDTEHSLLLLIEDDGEGIEADKIDEILQRGVRADEHIEGHGIGMAVVNELIQLMGGKLVGDRSERLGGMRWWVYFP